MANAPPTSVNDVTYDLFVGGENAVGPTPTRCRVFRDEEGDGGSEISRDGRKEGRTGKGKGEKRGRMGRGPEVSSNPSTVTSNIKSG